MGTNPEIDEAKAVIQELRGVLQDVYDERRLLREERATVERLKAEILANTALLPNLIDEAMRNGLDGRLNAAVEGAERFGDTLRKQYYGAVFAEIDQLRKAFLLKAEGLTKEELLDGFCRILGIEGKITIHPDREDDTALIDAVTKKEFRPTAQGIPITALILGGSPVRGSKPRGGKRKR